MASHPPSSARCACAPELSEAAVEGILAAVEPTRLQILFLIGERGSMCVGEIAKRFRISRPAISHHLKVLKNSGLVETERAGQEIYYTIRTASVVGTLRTLADAMEACCPRKGRASR